jgi:hypothetical protein
MGTTDPASALVGLRLTENRIELLWRQAEEIMMMRRPWGRPERPARGEDSLQRCAPDLIVTAGTGKLEVRDRGPCEYRPRPVPRESLSKFLLSLNTSTSEDDRVRRPSRRVTGFDGHLSSSKE